MNKLKILRDERGLTREELAVKLGLSGRYIGFIESEDRQPSLNTAKSIAEFFGKTVDEIFLNVKCTDSTLEGDNEKEV